jgi:pyruvate,water dikinase
MAEKEGKEGEIEFVKWFSELSNKDIKIAGGKGASLAEMANHKFPIPPGFVVAAQAYAYFIEKSGLKESIKALLESLDVEDTEKLEESTKKIRDMIVAADMPKEMGEEIVEAYGVLDVDKKALKTKGSAMDILRTAHEPPFVAVRSSATAEDLETASFAGQQESFLNVKGDADLIEKVKECFASLFTARATYYRDKKGFSHLDTHLAVVVQKMIDSDKSGVIFSNNPIKTDNSILIEAVWGLGEGIVSGRVKPDQYIVHPNLEEFKILEEKISIKKEAVARDSSGKNIVVELTEERGKQRVLSNYEIKMLAQYAKQLEEHYKKPQDIEFAIENEGIYVVQSRPVTTKAKEAAPEIAGEIILSGLGASPGVASGAVKIIQDISELSKIKGGDILVTKMTSPDMVVTMQKSAGIVTDEGGITSHAAIVSREMGIPAVVGTGEATGKLKEGEMITVDGNTGKIYSGRGESKLAEVKPVVKTKTKIKVIVDLPDFAERAAKSGVKGVGLTRIEGIIASSGKHPLAFKKEGKIKDYVQILHDGLKKISLPFDEMWVRTSDIRSDEYRHLEGAPKEVEGNPMLGDHGIRFGLRHPEILKAELTAVKELADEFPNKKFGFMFPQVISVAEIKEVKRIANEEIGMPSNIKMGIMVETPASVQIINDLCEEGIDFISFGTNDLTQYTLAIDRNNPEVQYLYDEINPAVLNSLSYVIRRCKKHNVETSICGQAGSKLGMVKFLVGEGIDSISVNADAARKISELVSKLEGMAPMEESKEEEKEESTKAEEPEEVEEESEDETEEVEEAEDKGGPLDIGLSEEKPEISKEMTMNQAMLGEDKDIEEVILKELDGGGKEEYGEEIKQEQGVEEPEIEKEETGEESGEIGEVEEKAEEDEESEEEEEAGEDAEDEYIPGDSDDKKDKNVPSLNDAIPVDSDVIEDESSKNEEELDLDEEKEWESNALEEEDEWEEDRKVEIF